MARKKGAYVLFFSKLDEHIPKWMFFPIFAQSYFHKNNWCRVEEENCGGDDDGGGDGCNCGCDHNRNVIVDYFDERVSGNG